MLARFERPNEAYLVAPACAAAPAGGPDAARLLALAERGAKASPTNPGFLTMLGAALSRAGRLEEAVQQLTKAREATAIAMPEEPIGCLFLAMAHARPGHA